MINILLVVDGETVGLVESISLDDSYTLKGKPIMNIVTQKQSECSPEEE